MGHTVGDGMIVVALAAAFVAYLYFRHVERHRRLDILHQERQAAMEKGIPLLELPLDPAPRQKRTMAQEVLLHGVVWLAFGAGGMLTLWMLGTKAPLPWPVALPLAFLGIGLILYHALVSPRAR